MTKAQMKKLILTLIIALVSGVVCYAYEGRIEIKDTNGKSAGTATWKSAKGSRINRDGWGNCYTVTIFNDSEEDIVGYVTINGMPNDREWNQRHSSNQQVSIPSKKRDTVTFYVGDETDACGYTVVLHRK